MFLIHEKGLNEKRFLLQISKCANLMFIYNINKQLCGDTSGEELEKEKESFMKTDWDMNVSY